MNQNSLCSIRSHIFYYSPYTPVPGRPHTSALRMVKEKKNNPFDFQVHRIQDWYRLYKELTHKGKKACKREQKLPRAHARDTAAFSESMAFPIFIRHVQLHLVISPEQKNIFKYMSHQLFPPSSHCFLSIEISVRGP